MNSKLKPFDPVAAMAGAKVVTRDGQSVRIICIDAGSRFPVVGLVGGEPCLYGNSGNYYCDSDTAELDLFMTPVMVTKWINIYHESTTGYIYDSKEEADRKMSANRIACVKVEYEV